MNVGILYNTFICLATGLTSLMVFNSLYKKRKRGEVVYNLAVDYFLLFLGLLWTLVGIRIFLVWSGHLEIELFVYKWFVGPLTYIHLIPAVYYLGWSFFKDKRTMQLLFNAFFTTTSLAAVFMLFLYGFTRPEVTYWGNNIIPNPISSKIFSYGVFLPAAPCIITELIRRGREWMKTRHLADRQLFGFALSLLIYAIAGFFEGLIFTQGWQMLLTRIGIMLSPLTLYLFTTLRDEE